MRFNRWNIAGFDREKAGEMCTNKMFPINPLVAVLLASRGITDVDGATRYLDDELTPFYDPMLMADMDKAVSRIHRAVEQKEHIVIYGDYDVDGMTSAALLALWLEEKGAKFEIYIPGRFDEGYGIHISALDTLKSGGAKLIISVDCGITATREAAYAKTIGLDLVITDHHECKGELPDAVAVVDPKRPDCNYPYSFLAGVGVVYKLVCALEGGNLSNEKASRYGQLAALGTVADVMPVFGENRKLIIQGLRQLNDNPGPGIKTLISEACPESAAITASAISFSLAPRLNAAGRMGDPMLSVRLLLSSDAEEAGKYVQELSRLNEERRSLEQEIMADAILQLEEMLGKMGKDEPTEPIVLSGRNWNQGVSGIVAAKMADRCRLPAIIISVDEGEGVGHGSCRSYGTFAIYDALCKCSDILTDFGGHEMAAGITLKKDNIDELRRRITESYNEHMQDLPETGLHIDFEVTKPRSLLTLENIGALKALEPYGRENPPPRLCIMGAELVGISPIGGGKHTKLRVESKSSAKETITQYSFECVFFGQPPDGLGVTVGDTVDIAFEPQINDFRDRKTVQLQLLDIRKSA